MSVPASLREIWQCFLIRLRLTLREPGGIAFGFVLPVIISIVLALATSSGDATVRIGLVGEEALARELQAADPSLEVQLASSREQGERDVQRGRFDALLIQGAPPELVVAEGRSEAKLATLLTTVALERVSGSRPPGEPTLRAMNAVGSRYIDFFIPGLLAFGMMNSAVYGNANILVLMRMNGLLRRLRATPLRRSSLLLGLVLGHFLQTLAETAVLLGVAWWLFGVQCVGSLPLFLGCTLAAAFCFVSIGLMIASRAPNFETSGGIAQLVLLPVMLLSGVFFSADRFPEALQPVLKLLPTRAALDAMRLVFNEGAELAALALPGAIMLGWSALTFALAVRFFKWD